MKLTLKDLYFIVTGFKGTPEYINNSFRQWLLRTLSSGKYLAYQGRVDTIFGRYFDHLTRKAIAVKLGKSTERIRQYDLKALRMLMEDWAALTATPIREGGDRRGKGTREKAIDRRNPLSDRKEL